MKRKKWLCILLCCGLLLTVLTACGDTGSEKPDSNPGGQETPPPPPPPPPSPPAVYTVDFSDGKSGFLMMNTGTPGTDPDSRMEIGNADGASALKMTAPNGGTLRLGINVDGLLGDRVTDVRMVVIEVYAEYPGGNFSAVSGRVAAMSGDMSAIADSAWQVYLSTRNPNTAMLEISADSGFSAAGPNLIEFSCTTNGPADRGETPAVICIKSIAFYDAGNTAIKVNTDAGWAAPEGYGEPVDLGGWSLPYPTLTGRPGDWEYWLTPGTDNIEEEYMPWEVLAASYGIVIVVDEAPESFEFVFFGGFNGWGWTQVPVADYWADGEITIMWEDIGFDPTLVTEDDTAVKLAMGNWSEVSVSDVYLLYDADAVP